MIKLILRSSLFREYANPFHGETLLEKQCVQYWRTYGFGDVAIAEEIDRLYSLIHRSVPERFHRPGGVPVAMIIRLRAGYRYAAIANEFSIDKGLADASAFEPFAVYTYRDGFDNPQMLSELETLWRNYCGTYGIAFTQCRELLDKSYETMHFANLCRLLPDMTPEEWKAAIPFLAKGNSYPAVIGRIREILL
jgi:hypothetical protein